MDLNKLIARVKAILLTPKTEWPVIASEPATLADLYKGYIVWLAAIPAVLTFVKMSLIGVSVPFAGTVRTAIGPGLTSMVVTYGLGLAMIYVMALIVEALAPTFGGQKNRLQALKTVAYAYTAAWVAGIGMIVPGIALLIGIAGMVYSIYLLYLGLPNTMKCPPEKAAGYTAVAVIVAIVLGFVVGAVISAISGTGPFMRGSGAFTADDDVTFDKNSPLGKMEQWSKEVEAASKKFEAAEKSGDADAQAEALKDMMGAAFGGGGRVEALAPARLERFVPESLAGLTRASLSAERNDAMGMQMSEVIATYADENTGRSINLEITDAGTAKGLLLFAGWAGMESESETEDGYEKTYRKGDRLIHEQWDRAGSYGEYAIVLGERFTVKIDGEARSIDELRAALHDLDLRGLEALKNEGVATN